MEIAERDYSGPSEDMEFAGGSRLSITWENRGDEFYVPVKASEANIKVMCRDNFHFIGLFTSDPRKFRVSIYRNTVLYWRGFVVADLYSESFTSPPCSVLMLFPEKGTSSCARVGGPSGFRDRRSLQRSPER